MEADEAIALQAALAGDSFPEICGALENDSKEDFSELYEWAKSSYVNVINPQFKIKRHTRTVMMHTLKHKKVNILKYMLSNNIVNINLFYNNLSQCATLNQYKNEIKKIIEELFYLIYSSTKHKYDII